MKDVYFCFELSVLEITQFSGQTLKLNCRKPLWIIYFMSIK